MDLYAQIDALQEQIDDLKDVIRFSRGMTESRHTYALSGAVITALSLFNRKLTYTEFIDSYMVARRVSKEGGKQMMRLLVGRGYIEKRFGTRYYDVTKLGYELYNKALTRVGQRWN